MKKLFYLVLIIISVSCITLKKNHNYTRTYIVHANEHYSTKEVEAVGNPLKGTIYTDESWWWPVPEKNGWSKVTGIGNAQSEKKEGNRIVYLVKDIMYHGIQKTVGLFGWYVCDDGYCEHSTKPDIVLDTIFDFKTKHKFDFEIGFEGYDKAYVIWNKKYKRIKPVTNIHGFKYLNHPYIGGTYTIPHDWIVKIKYY